MKLDAKWIKPSAETGSVCPVFKKNTEIGEEVKYAELIITARGVYEAKINGKRVGDFILAPGWTVYEKRLQFQRYDVTDMLGENTEITVAVGNGWYRSVMPGWIDSLEKKRDVSGITPDLLAQLEIEYTDGRKEIIATDETWLWSESKIRLATIYDGEVYDANIEEKYNSVVLSENQDKSTLIEQEGEKVCEHERLKPMLVITPKGEQVLDFGQNLTGYVEFEIDAAKNEKIKLTFGEILSEDGNFFNDNYRSAKDGGEIYYCRDGKQKYKPALSFFGFRYAKVDGIENVNPDNFTAIAVYSDMERTGFIECSDKKLNKLFSNIIWGQKSNYLDIPTDCPQRDERLGWTGDAQVFVKTASYNFDVKKFYGKWLHDLAACQEENGKVGNVVPDVIFDYFTSSAWGDAATICPWTIYMTYGDEKILQDQFESMKKWIGYIQEVSHDKYLWTGCMHMGDWLALDAPEPDDCFGGSNRDFIATVFLIYSTTIVIKTGKILGEDISYYEKLLVNIKKEFKARFTEVKTQTEHVLLLYFGLAEDRKKTAKELADMILENGNRLKTGFVGTPYLLHVLSDNGYSDIAYSLLMQEEYPSWLYCVNKGATTIWEHWNSVEPNGDLNRTRMNSYNHYAYGSAADWVYEVAAGIKPIEEYPGFERIKIQPIATERLDWLSASVKTKYGTISSKWINEKDKIRYEIKTPSPSLIVIGDREYRVEPGEYVFYNEKEKMQMFVK